jgi:MFS family permease
MSTPKTVDVDTFVGGLKFGPFHILIISICTILMMVDGYELYVLGWVLPKVADDFGIARTALTSVLVAQQIGMVAGTYFVTTMADKLGRQRVMTVAFCGILISCGICIVAQSAEVLMVGRLITGFFASAVLPMLIAIGTENAPKNMRATVGTIVITGTLGGSLIGSFMQAFMLEPLGWRSAFWLGGGMAAAMLPVIWFLLPDTLRYLMARNPNDPRIPALVRRMNPKGEDVVVVPVVKKEVAAGEQSKDTLWQGLFGEGRALRTIFLWLAFMSSFTYISAGNWKTTIYHDTVGMTWQQVGLATALGTGFGIAGNIVIGMAIDRWSFRSVLSTSFFLAAIFVVLMGMTVHSMGLFFVMLVATSIFQHGGQAGLGALSSTVYPPKQSASGVGWAYGAGRIASIFAPILGAIALSQKDLSPLMLLSLFAIPLACGGLFVLLATTVGGKVPEKRAAALAH